jgi:hypothetical protein
MRVLKRTLLALFSKRTLGTVLLGVLLIAVAGAGYASRKYKHTSGYAGGAHTILYRIEYFQEDGSPAGIGFVARQVRSDGSWRNVTTLPDGKTGSTSGKINSFMRVDPNSATMQEHLGYSCEVRKDAAGESWFSGDLQDMTKLETKDPNGVTRSRMYAVDISRE